MKGDIADSKIDDQNIKVKACICVFIICNCMQKYVIVCNVISSSPKY